MDALARENNRRQAEFDFSKVEYCRIHPGIGIARVGNSDSDFFIGPETPCDPRDVVPPAGGYKDAQGFVKRQAARFRIYAYRVEEGKEICLGELPVRGKRTGAHELTAEVEWTVRLANRKGASANFVGRYGKPDGLRNRDIPHDRRGELIVDPGPRTITGEGKSENPVFDEGTFRGTKVELGMLKVDDEGRLLVLGGFGRSGSTKIDNPIGVRPDGEYYANNDHWFDDTSDGFVMAVVRLPEGEAGRIIRIEKPAHTAWVVVAPPKYAPGIQPVVTLYDVIRDVARSQPGWSWPDGHSGRVEYHRDIRPILMRASETAWVNSEARRGHGAGKMRDFSDPAIEQELSVPGKNDSLRRAVFDRLRDPAGKPEQANGGFMPVLSGDGGDAATGQTRTWFSLLPAQYDNFREWAENRFDTGTRPSFPPLHEMTPGDQTIALQRAALDPCAGGPFYPGIEMTYTACAHGLYCAAFRIDRDKHKPGEVTELMALPWQADFYMCNTNWWPSQRPDDVIPEDVFKEANDAWHKTSAPVTEVLEGRERWERGLGVTTLFRRRWLSPMPPTVPDDPLDSDRRGCDDMVRYWHELAFVVPRLTASGKARRKKEIVHVETERRPYAGMDTRGLFHALLNREEHLDCLPKAREYVEHVLEAAREIQQRASAFAFMENIRPFRYDEEAFDERMQDIYDDCSDFAFTERPEHQLRQPYDPENGDHNPWFRSREQVIERIIQLTPFNYLDGAWLRNVHRLGPMDEVNSILFAIFNEELGDGVLSQNHANIYRDLCHSFGFYPAPAASIEFARDVRFLDAAFDSAALQLAIAEFSETYYPEIIGMTLWLEWTVLELHRIAAIVERVGLSSHFYRMHIAIDNADNGHAARIQRAVKLYLQGVREHGGEDAVQCQWARIWDGYVAFGYTFSVLITQIKTVLKAIHDVGEQPDVEKRIAHLEGQLAELIQRKKTYGQYNHTRKHLGGESINQLFSRPGDFLAALKRGVKREAGKQPRPYIVPGKPDESAFFELLEFKGGPMYHVFTEEEIKLWRDWVLELGRVERHSVRHARTPAGTTTAAASESATLSGHAGRSRLRHPASHARTAVWEQVAQTRSAQGDVAEDAGAAAYRGAVGSDRLKAWIGWSMLRAITHLAAHDANAISELRSFVVGSRAEGGVPCTEWCDRIRTAPNPAVPARDFLAELAGFAEGSALQQKHQELADPQVRLPAALEIVPPGNDGRRVLDTLAGWIEHGCPVPEIHVDAFKPLRLESTLDEEERHPLGFAIGFGTVH